MNENKVAGHIGHEPTGPEAYVGFDPVRDPERWERMVSRIEVAAAPELERRRVGSPVSMLAVLNGWRRGGLWTAGLVAAAASAVLLLSSGSASQVPVDETIASTSAVLHPADAMVPELGSWLRTGEAPTVLALLEQFGDVR